MPSDAVPKMAASSPILDRFRLLLKEREDEFRFSTGDEDDDFVPVPPPSTVEIVRFYEDVLSELTMNSKPIITDLTIIADQQREHGEGIADAICARVLEVPLGQKLPSLYLLDSIVKNVGQEYVGHFASRLPEVFCEVYRQVPPNLHPSMRHLFGTWSTVFPRSVLRKIEDELQFSPRVNQPSSSLQNMRASESPRPSHGIHVNPKYLEARRQFDNSSINSSIQLARGTSNSKTLGHKHPIAYEDYDSDQGEGPSSHIGAQRFNSTGYGVNKLLPSLSGPGRPLSPSVDEYERTSPSRPGYIYGRRMRERDEEIGDWQKKHRSDDLYRGFDNIPNYNISNGLDHDRPRALIDAYGHDDGKRPLNEKPLEIVRHVANGGLSKISSRSWQNTEEEEFDWEDMSPTLADSSNLPSRGFRARPGRDSYASTAFDPNFKSNWTTSSRISRLEDSQKAVEDASLIRNGGRGSSNKVSISRNEINQITPYHHSQGAWKLPGSLADPIQNLPSVARESSSQLTFAPSGLTSSSPDRKFPIVSSDFSSLEARAPSPAMAPISTTLWPSTSSHNMMPLPPLFPQIHPRHPFDYTNRSYRLPNQGSQPFDSDDSRNPIFGKPTQLNHPGFTPLHHPTQAPPHMPPQAMVPAVSLGYTPLGHGVGAGNIVKNLIPGFHPSLPIQNVPNGSVQFQAPGRPLPLGVRPPSQFLAASHSSGPHVPPTSGFSGLINSLVNQGLISLGKQTPEQDHLGEDFNPDLLKVRYESSIRALYEDLPRQCTTCGLRFKTQEEHSKHMDWHVTKNRILKNRKQNPSRKWFVSASMWLSGAEALGVDAVPGFLPTETSVEKKDDEEMAVPADEDQNTCALCGEPFEDFYSDETEEWMYRGAVYLNAPDGLLGGMDRSQLGPIVHAKCRSESSTAPS